MRFKQVVDWGDYEDYTIYDTDSDSFVYCVGLDSDKNLCGVIKHPEGILVASFATLKVFIEYCGVSE